MTNADQNTQQNALDSKSRWVTFRLGKEVYGINVLQVQEVLKVTEIAPVPGAPDYVLGIVNLRGNVVTVIDTRKRFGLAPAEIDPNLARIVIIESDNQVVGMLVDSVSEVVELNEENIDSTPNIGSEENSKYILGVSNYDNDLLILVDLNKLIYNEEWKSMVRA
ncbi:MAG: chemotaxis protein CheW [Gammaproteobacteria bacterium RBG_16_57_12]|nr:MAG: chemotaxis protein CheW [Gammaproteobacteria bacterium RBG_16_57_12]